jgi:drug/metabolite transporter (DMT)-like permease
MLRPTPNGGLDATRIVRSIALPSTGGHCRRDRRSDSTAMRRPAPATPLRENLLGIAAIVACNLVFLINDTMLKLVSVRLPLGEIMFLRGAFATFLISALVAAYGLHRQIGRLLAWPVFWRTVAEIGGAFLYILALFHMPIANINAILQIVPLMITAAGALFLHEEVGWRRWIAIAVGFAGVLVIVRPGLGGFDLWGLLALGAMLLIMLRDLATRVMQRGVHALLVAFVTAIAVGVAGAVYGLDEVWPMPQSGELIKLACASVLVVAGYLTAVQAMRHGNISVVAPFRYTVVVFAIIVGFLVWDEIPDAPMLIGTTVIIASGIYTLYRERKTANLAAEALAGEGM